MPEPTPEPTPTPTPTPTPEADPEPTPTVPVVPQQAPLNKPLNIAIVTTVSDVYAADVVAKLFASNKFGNVTVYNASSSTPTLDDLQLFSALMVFTDPRSGGCFANAKELGDVLAQYSATGGGLVLAGGAFGYTPKLNTTGASLVCISRSYNCSCVLAIGPTNATDGTSPPLPEQTIFTDLAECMTVQGALAGEYNHDVQRAQRHVH